MSSYREMRAVKYRKVTFPIKSAIHLPEDVCGKNYNMKVQNLSIRMFVLEYMVLNMKMGNGKLGRIEKYKS